MKKARIIQRTKPNGVVVYVIQIRRWYTCWRYADLDPYGWDSYETLAEALAVICWYDGTRNKDVQVYPPK